MRRPAYYLALGDSLSRGIQPGRDGVLVETEQGYVDDLYAILSPAPSRPPPRKARMLGRNDDDDDRRRKLFV